MSTDEEKVHLAIPTVHVTKPRESLTLNNDTRGRVPLHFSVPRLPLKHHDDVSPVRRAFEQEERGIVRKLVHTFERRNSGVSWTSATGDLDEPTPTESQAGQWHFSDIPAPLTDAVTDGSGDHSPTSVKFLATAIRPSITPRTRANYGSDGLDNSSFVSILTPTRSRQGGSSCGHWPRLSLESPIQTCDRGEATGSGRNTLTGLPIYRRSMGAISAASAPRTCIEMRVDLDVDPNDIYGGNAPPTFENIRSSDNETDRESRSKGRHPHAASSSSKDAHADVARQVGNVRKSQCTNSSSSCTTLQPEGHADGTSEDHMQYAIARSDRSSGFWTGVADLFEGHGGHGGHTESAMVTPLDHSECTGDNTAPFSAVYIEQTPPSRSHWDVEPLDEAVGTAGAGGGIMKPGNSSPVPSVTRSAASPSRKLSQSPCASATLAPRAPATPAKKPPQRPSGGTPPSAKPTTQKRTPDYYLITTPAGSAGPVSWTDGSNSCNREDVMERLQRAEEKLRMQSERHEALEQHWRRRNEEMTSDIHNKDIELTHREAVLSQREERCRQRAKETAEAARRLAEDREEFDADRRDLKLRKGFVAEKEMTLKAREDRLLSSPQQHQPQQQQQQQQSTHGNDADAQTGLAVPESGRRPARSVRNHEGLEGERHERSASPAPTTTTTAARGSYKVCVGDDTMPIVVEVPAGSHLYVAPGADEHGWFTVRVLPGSSCGTGAAAKSVAHIPEVCSAVSASYFWSLVLPSAGAAFAAASFFAWKTWHGNIRATSL